MFIQIEDTQANRGLVEAFNGLIDRLNILSGQRAALELRINADQDKLDKYKNFKNLKEKERQNFERGLNDLREQINVIYNSINSASETKKEELEKELKDLTIKYQEFKREEAELESYVEKYSEWIDDLNIKKNENNKSLKKVSYEIEDASKNIVVLSKMLQGKCGIDFYSSLIISSVRDRSGYKAKVLGADNLKITIANTSEDQNEN